EVEPRLPQLLREGTGRLQPERPAVHPLEDCVVGRLGRDVPRRRHLAHAAPLAKTYSTPNAPGTGFTRRREGTWLDAPPPTRGTSATAAGPAPTAPPGPRTVCAPPGTGRSAPRTAAGAMRAPAPPPPAPPAAAAGRARPPARAAPPTPGAPARTSAAPSAASSPGPPGASPAPPPRWPRRRTGPGTS